MQFLMRDIKKSTIYLSIVGESLTTTVEAYIATDKGSTMITNQAGGLLRYVQSPN